MINKTRAALIIANFHFDDPDFQQLASPSHDAESFGKVLSDPNIGDFQITTLINKTSYEIRQAIEEFYDDRKKNDLLLLYFSGHGIKNEDGKLFLVGADTKRKKLRSTAISSTFINEVMQNSRSRQQIVILDCCFSGAFAKGVVAKSSKEMFINEHFEGQGRIILTASNAMQYSFEGDTIQGSAVESIFTHSLVEGLTTGEADIDQDGYISIDELYQYTITNMDMLPQKPMKWSYDVYGDLIIAFNPYLDPRKPDQSINLSFILEMIDHAKEEFPNMACGLLGGTPSGEITTYYRCRNAAKKPSNRFLIDASDQINILLELESKKQELLGIFYSDPNWNAYPSQITLEESFYSEVLYFVLSFNKPMHPIIRAFWLDRLNDNIKECELKVSMKE